MTPEAAYFFEKAKKLLAEADAMLSIGLTDAAGRSAYLAAFHAAQAFVSETTGKAVKTHRGLHGEFYRLTKDDPRIHPDLRSFLSQSYNLKAIADYETGPAAHVSSEQAAAAILGAKRFVACFEAVLNEIE